MCLDGWALLVEDVEREQPDQPVPIKLFFVTYIFVVVYVLIPVFVAAILDGYRTATYMQTRTDQKKKRQEVTLSDEGELRLSIDPVLHSLISATTQKQLDDKLNVLFDIVDGDESGYINYEELKMGFLRIAGGVMGTMSMEEYEGITRGGEYVNENGELDRESFKLVMKEQLHIYVQRKLAQYIRAIGKEDPSQVSHLSPPAKLSAKIMTMLLIPVFYFQELIFFALKSLAADSSALVDFRHHPIAMHLRVRSRADACAHKHAHADKQEHTHTHTHTHTHARAQISAYTLRNEIVSGQVLEEKIEAEQAERQKEQDRINQKLDLVLARLGREGGGVGTGKEIGMQPMSDHGTGARSSAHAANGTTTKIHDVSCSEAEGEIPHPVPPLRISGSESDAHDARRQSTASFRGLDEDASNPLPEFEA